MKCSTINLRSIQLFIFTLTVIGSTLANGSKSISQSEQAELKELMPEFREGLVKWIEFKQQESKVKKSNDVASGYSDCLLCKTSVEITQLATSISEKTVVSIIRNTCVYLGIESVDVCKGIVDAFREEFLLIVKNVDLSPGQLCTISLGNSCNEDIDPRLNWTLPLPPKPAADKQEENEKQIDQQPINRSYPLRKKARETFKFVQISDTHVDTRYVVDTNAVCNEPVCCRAKNTERFSRKLDMNLKRKARMFNVKLTPNDELTAGQWGSYGKCDIPLHTFKLALKQIAAKHSNEIDYVIWTGDVSPHDVWRQSKENQISMIKIAAEQFIIYLNDTPIYPAIGNHEGFPVNSFPPKDILPSYPEINMDWLYKPLNEVWGNWLPTATTSSIKKGAYYSIKTKENLRIISLNTNYCNDQNWWLLINGTDPENELTWLIQQLVEAEKANESVHIIGHIPPGTNDCLQIWSENYYRIISRFNNTVKAQFYGHTHSDGFELFFDHNQLNVAKTSTKLTDLNPVSVAYLAPSLTTFIGTNPGYRIYEVDAKTFEVINFRNYYLDLPHANRKSAEDPNFTPEFEYACNPIDYYGMADLSPQSWLSLAERIYNNFTLLNDYLYLSKNKASSEEMVRQICANDKCKKERICQILRAKSHDKQVCDEAVKRFKN